MQPIKLMMLTFFVCVGLSPIAQADPNQNKQNRSVKIRGNKNTKKLPIGNQQRAGSDQGSITIGAGSKRYQVSIGGLTIPTIRRVTHTRDVRKPGQAGPHIIELELPLPIPAKIRNLWAAAQSGKSDKTNISIAYLSGGQVQCSNQYTGCWPNRVVETFEAGAPKSLTVYRWLCPGEIRIGGSNVKPSCG